MNEVRQLRAEDVAAPAFHRAVMALTGRFVCAEGPAQAIGPTGEPYVVTKGGGHTVEEAIGEWLREVEKVIPPDATHLFWRIRPEIARDRINDLWHIYSRQIFTTEPEHAA